MSRLGSTIGAALCLCLGFASTASADQRFADAAVSANNLAACS